MSNRAQAIREAEHGLTVTRRGRRFIEVGLGGRRWRRTYTVEPLHTLDGREIDTSWRRTEGGDWDWEIVDADYRAEAGPLRVDGGDAIRFAKGGQSVGLRPVGVYWADERGARQSAAELRAGEARADGPTLTWPDAFGRGVHFRYRAHPTKLFKEFVLESRDALPTPTGRAGERWLEVAFVLSRSAGATARVGGAAWDRRTAVDAQRVTFTDAKGGALWDFASPVARDADGDRIAGTLRLWADGGVEHVSVRFPEAWLSRAAYPVVLDPTLIDVQPGAAAGQDVDIDQSAPNSNWGTEATMWLRGPSAMQDNGLIRFDLGAASGADITSATLTLTLGQAGAQAANSITVYRILPANASWGESTATWNRRDGTNNWAGSAGCNTAGTDHSSTAMGSTSFSNPPSGTAINISLDTSAVEEMIAANAGMILKTAVTHTYQQVCTSDHGTAAYRPRLVIEGEDAGADNDLEASDLVAGAPVLGKPTVGQTHTLEASGIVAGAPILGEPTLGQTFALAADGIATGAPVLGTPAVGQTHTLTAAGLVTGAPVLGKPELSQPHELTADDLVAGQPVLGQPTLGQVHALQADDLAAGAPILGTPALSQTHDLAADDLVAGSPVLGEPELGQVHALQADDLIAGAPVLGKPVLAQLGVNELMAEGLVAGAPVLGEPTVGQVHALEADGLVTGPAVLGTPSLGQVHDLQADDLVAGSPILGKPELGQVQALEALSLVAGAPILGRPVLGQVHALEALSLLLGAPVLGEPTLGGGVPVHMVCLDWQAEPLSAIYAQAAPQAAAVGSTAHLDHVVDGLEQPTIVVGAVHPLHEVRAEVALCKY